MTAAWPLEQLLAEWKEAEERARKAELALYACYLDFTSGRGPPPSEEQRRAAASLRAEARARYDAAMAAVDEVLARAAERSSRW